MVVLYFRRDTVKKIRETVPTEWELRYLCLCIRAIDVAVEQNDKFITKY